MNLKVYYEFYSQFSHQYVSAGIAAIFKTILLQYKSSNVVCCVTVTPLQLFVMEWRRHNYPRLYVCVLVIISPWRWPQ